MGELIGVDEARRRVLAETSPLPAEDVPLAEGLGRVLAEDVAADVDLPPFDCSAMDGYAIVAGAAAELRVVGESRAGHPAGRAVERGEAIRISTGAVLPAGADSVVPVERVEPGARAVRVPDWEPGRNVRRAGEDLPQGEVVLRAGCELGPAELAMLAAVGRPRARCARRPRVAVLATGDELVEPGQPLGPGQIRDSNPYAIAAQAQRAGARVVMRRRVPDDLASTRAALAEALACGDVVCVSGGVSVGPHDHVKPALAELGAVERFWGVALKPGKPTWFGTTAGVLVFGLPGNPVSAMVTFQLFGRPALRALAGADPGASRTSGILDEAVERDRREQAIRCRLGLEPDGWHVAPTKAQGSHVLSSMVGAGALALVAPGDGALAPGDRVPIELLD